MAQKTSVDDVLKRPELVGWQRWGMAMLYYRAGVNQEDIARVFDVRRQVVCYQIRRAFEVAAQHAKIERRCRRETARRSRVPKRPKRGPGETT